MAMARKKLPVFPGVGELRYPGFRGQVQYEIHGEPSKLRGIARLRGSITATPEVALGAFQQGDGVLTLDTGTEYRVKMLAHSEGSDTAYFEMLR
jgi:hypothetical protein